MSEKFLIGDKVQYTKNFMRSIGLWTVPQDVGIKGTITDIKKGQAGREWQMLKILWEPESGKNYETDCISLNIERVS